MDILPTTIIKELLDNNAAIVFELHVCALCAMSFAALTAMIFPAFVTAVGAETPSRIRRIDDMRMVGFPRLFSLIGQIRDWVGPILLAWVYTRSFVF
jgi:hypothetical protein